MKRNCFIIILFFVSISFLHSDFIIPPDDPVYSFLESMNNLGYTEKTFFIYPQYYNEITNILMELRTQDLPKQYLKLAEYHYERLSMNFPEGVNSDVYPLRKIPQSAFNTFKSHSDKKRLVTFNKDDYSLFLSGMMGVNYDTKRDSFSKWRSLKYYGMEFGGNIKENFGFYSRFKKGHYKGNEEFIREDYRISEFVNWNNVEVVSMCSETDYKNRYLNLSLGFGTLQIGKSITTSIILNPIITSYPYFKYYKRFGNFHYLAFNAQLLPDSLNNEAEYKTKSYALQTIYYSVKNFSLGIGECALYGDKNIDLSYITPLVMYKLVDFVNHSRDNVNGFLFGTYNPFKGMMIYGNFFIDDFKISRMSTDKAFSGFAYQNGITYAFSKIPLQIAFEMTAVGPRTYCHRRYLPYTHDSQLLGYPNGSNQLNIATQIQYLHPRLVATLYYDNMQQGSISNNPFVPQPNTEFLAGKISRTEKITTEIKYYPYPEISIHLKYEFQKKEENNTNYLYSGLEVRY